MCLKLNIKKPIQTIFYVLVSVTFLWIPTKFATMAYFKYLPHFRTYSAEKILENTYRVNGPHCKEKNIYFIVDKNVSIIDPSFQVPIGGIEEALQSIDKNISDVRSVICTHYHVDHTGTAKDIAAQSGAEVYIHPNDIPFLVGKNKHEFPNAGLWYRVLLRIGISLLPSWHMDDLHPIREGDRIPDLSNYDIIETPGHTPGSISLYNRKKKIGFTGDALQHFDGKIRLAKPQYSMDHKAERESAWRLLQLEYRAVLPSDGTIVIENVQEKLDAFRKTFDREIK